MRRQDAGGRQGRNELIAEFSGIAGNGNRTNHLQAGFISYIFDICYLACELQTNYHWQHILPQELKRTFRSIFIAIGIAIVFIRGVAFYVEKNVSP